MIKIDCLYSGSDGNSFLIRSNNNSILIDCGGTCTSLNKRLYQFGSSLDQISDIFITHEHSDHISAAEIISKKYNINFHITKDSADGLSNHLFLRQHLIIHPTKYSVIINNLEIRSFKLPHDSNNNVGYIIEDFMDHDKVGIATDMGTNKQAKINMAGCRLAIIEANHDVNILRNGPYPIVLQDRILSSHGHLSNEDCADLALCLAQSGTKEFWLAHISHINNEPCLPTQVVTDKLLKNGIKDYKISECISRKGIDL